MVFCEIKSASDGGALRELDIRIFTNAPRPVSFWRGLTTTQCPLSEAKRTCLDVRFREQLSMSMRVMGGRDIKIAAALFAFYHEVSHLVIFHSFQNAGFALAT